MAFNHKKEEKMSSIKINSKKTFSFSWLDSKNNVVATSVEFTTEADCLKAIELFKNEAVGAAIENQTISSSVKRTSPKFVITSVGKSFTFAFESSGKKTILTSAKFTTLVLCQAAIEDIKKNAESAYNQFLIEHRSSLFLAEVEKADTKTLATKLNVVKTGLRKVPTFTLKKATPVFSSKALETDNLKKLNTTRQAILRVSKGKKPTFIDGKFASSKITSFKSAISALNNLHYTMGFKNAEQEFKEDSLFTHPKANFYRLQQYHNGIPVFGRRLVVSTDANGNAESVSGRYADISTSASASVNEENALDVVKKLVPDAVSIASDGLFYYVDKNDKSSLCWKVSTDDSIYFIDASKASVVDTLPTRREVDRVSTDVGKNMSNQEVRFPVIVKNDRNNTRYLYDSDRNIEMRRCRSANDRDGRAISGTSSTWTGEKDAISAYTNMITTYDYYKNVLGRKGANGNGKKVSVVVGFYKYSGSTYSNAFFTSSYSGVTKICLGNGNNYAKPLDVIAHEFTHAVEDSIWDPIYRNESGALDEAYADIMGEFVQDGDLDLHGEDLMYGANRSFINPKSTGCPDHYKDLVTGSGDNGGVHSNSSIINHAAYLMQKNWPNKATFRMEMPVVFYLSMQYLDSDATFLDFRSALLKAARVAGLGTAKENIIAQALDDVGVSYPEDIVAKNTILTGKVVNDSGNAIVDAKVTLKKGSKIVQVVTKSSGLFELGFNTSGSYTLTVESPAYKTYSSSMTLSALGGNKKIACGDIRLTLKEENIAVLQGNVRNYETRAAEANVEIRIFEGSVDVDRGLAQTPSIKVYTDNNGYYTSKAVKKGVTYTIIACKNLTNAGQYLVASQTVLVNGKTTCNLDVKRKSRYFVNGLWVYASSKKSNARNGIKPPYKLIDKDLNGWAGGDYIYLGYTIADNGSPVTNMIIYNTKKKQTWKTKSITIDGKTAEYTRLDVDLNKGAKGSFVYLCLTRDTKFAPVTDVDVVYQGDTVDTRSWKYTSATGDYSSADVNYKTKGKPIYIVIKRD